jgi:myo-inositol-1-phosphate synthase
MTDIKIAIAGLGNCASALIQGLEYYKKITGDEAYFHGLMNPTIGGYTPVIFQVKHS